VTRTPLSRSKGQGHQAALLTAVLARQAAAAVGMGTCWSWETAATLPSARPLRRPRGRRGSGAYRGGRPPTACFHCQNKISVTRMQSIMVQVLAICSQSVVQI